MANILIVDDSVTVRTQLKIDLANEGHSSREAGNGVEALRLLEADGATVDLMLCDVNMPEMDGLTLCRELHKHPDLRNIPIVMLTTQTGADMKAEGKEHGVIAWVVKPYGRVKLMAGIAKVLSRSNTR